MSSSTANSKLFIVTGTVCALAIPLTYYYHKITTLHRDLAERLSHQSLSGDEEILAKHARSVNTIPVAVKSSSGEYVVAYDRAIVRVPTSGLPNRSIQYLLTAYLQHNMCRFARLPQAWILWLMADGPGKKSFDQCRISKLNFDVGDQVCGSYIVRHRMPGQVEFGMSMGKVGEDGYIDGRLVLSLEIKEDDGIAVFGIQTFMWRKKASSTIMPLERPIAKWLHELTSWWLIDQGTRFLTQPGQDLETHTT